MKRVPWFPNPLIGAAGSSIDLGWTFHVQSFVRTFVVELFDEGVELGLLLEQICAGGPRGFLLERQVYAFTASILLGMTRPDAFDADAQAQPPNR